MGAKMPASLGAALFGRTKRELLALVYTRPERSFYLREIVRALGLGQGAVQRELARLTCAGLLVRQRIGNQVHFRANRGSPVFPELRSLIMKSAGMADVLWEALAPLSGRIAVTFVYGPMARSGGGLENDVDLLVIGNVGLGEVIAALQPAQAAIGREINPAVYSSEQYFQKIRDGDHFLRSAMEGPKIFLTGNEDELERLGGGTVSDAL
jgi:DNA-binding transcriptional ArsR family regulator